MHCNRESDVVIIKPVKGRARICSASLKNTRRLIALGFHKEKEKKFVNIHIPVIQFLFTQYVQYAAIYCSTQYIGMSKCIELHCTMSYCKVKSHGCNACTVIVVQVISTDVQSNERTQKKSKKKSNLSRDKTNSLQDPRKVFFTPTQSSDS